MAARGLRAALAAAISIGAAVAAAQSVQDCGAVDADRDRLACYDRAAGRRAPLPHAPATAVGAPQPARAAQPSPLGERWAIDERGAGGMALRPHEPTYLLFGRVSDAANQRPGSPTRRSGPVDIGLQDTEAKFQLSFKFRVVDTGARWTPDLWVGYTQQSHWQVYNPGRSRLFRETNYAPELMAAWHPDTQLGPLRWRLFNLSLMHQSNGRSEVLSRSWNRVYAQFGLEAGNFALLVRPWVRISEQADKDDNPDIRGYLGHGDMVATWRWREHVLAAKLRQNFGTGRGYVEANWSFPLVRCLNGYLQATSGYGESLIDYNWRQNTIGIGVSLFDWQ